MDILRLLAVALLVSANGFFVAAEFALVSVRRTRVVELLEQGNPSARWVQKAIDDPDRFIAATQLGITLASLGLGWIGEPALGNLIRPLIELFPAEIEEQVSHSISAGLSFAIITFLHVVVGELAPKSIALQNAERTSLVVARPTVWTERIFKPFIWALNGTGNALLRWAGVQPASGHELVHSVEELKMLVSASAESGVVQDGAEEMLHAIFDFGQTLVRHVMVPRTEMVAVPKDIDLESLLELATEQPYSKFPVYSDSLDQILGIVHLKDLLQASTLPVKAPDTAEGIMREAIFVPETARIGTLLSLFRTRQQHIAIVLDEYGGTAGVVTLSDLLEEIVGEVNDQFADEPDILALPDGSALVDGLTPIDEVNEHFNLMLSDPHYDTLAGYLLGKLERLAQVGDKVVIDGVRLQVEAMDGLRIARISLSSWPPTPETPKSTDEE
jgi:CBS domain containing-hemolysin-like protein